MPLDFCSPEARAMARKMACVNQAVDLYREYDKLDDEIRDCDDEIDDLRVLDDEGDPDEDDETVKATKSLRRYLESKQDEIFLKLEALGYTPDEARAEATAGVILEISATVEILS